jgi:hypothetical protein
MEEAGVVINNPDVIAAMNKIGKIIQGNYKIIA